MRARRLNFSDHQQLFTCLFHESAAGVQLSGDSGSGKSNAMEFLAQTVAAAHPLLYIDPHGLSARRFYRYCLSRPSLAARTFYIQPSDTRHVVSINPLAMPSDMTDELAWFGILASKCEMVARIFLTAWGEVNFNSRPRMFTWTYRLLTTLARIGLSIPEARMFLDTHCREFHSLVKAVPELMSRHAFEELAAMRPSERDEQIESTRTRFLGFLSNKILEVTLGRVDGALDLKRLYQGGQIVIVNLEQGGVLREQDQEILANLYLTESIYTVMNLPESERRPFFIFIDELPVFASSAPLLTRTLAQIRKYQTRIVAAHQGTGMFAERTDDRLLHAFVSQCRAHFYFRHQNPVDAKFFGEIISLPGFSPTKIKHELYQQVQYQDGHDLVILTDEGETTAEADSAGGAQSTGSTQTDTRSSDSARSTTDTRGRTRDEQLLHETVNEARAEATANRTSQGSSSGTSQESTNNWSKTTTRGTSRTRKQTLVPRLKWRDVLASVQFLTPEEQLLAPASRLTNLPTGTALFHLSGIGVTEAPFPLVGDPFAQSPKFAAKKEANHLAQLLKQPEYATPAAIEDQRRLLLDALLRYLQKLPSGSAPGASRGLLPLADPPAPADDDPPDSPLTI